MDLRQINGHWPEPEDQQALPFSAVGVCIVWVVLLLLGFFVLAQYQLKTGDAAASIPRIHASGLPIEDNRNILLLAVHPFCPCSNATIEELNRLLSRRGQKPALKALVYVPEGGEVNLERNTKIQSLTALGFEIVPDRNGERARALGAHTSGHVFYFDASGTLRFSGGITAFRGHAGANPSEDQLLEQLERENGRASFAPVFGCSLQGEEKL